MQTQYNKILRNILGVIEGDIVGVDDGIGTVRLEEGTAKKDMEDDNGRLGRTVLVVGMSTAEGGLETTLVVGTITVVIDTSAPVD